MKQKLLHLGFLITLLTSLVSSATAHCTWVEAPASVETGQEAAITLFWADPEEPVEKRDSPELTLRIQQPDGQVLPVNTDHKGTFQQAQWEFSQQGVHTLLATREPARHRMSQYRDFGKTLLLAGPASEAPAPAGLELEITPLELPAPGVTEVPLQIHYFGKPLAGAELKIITQVDRTKGTYQSLHDDKQYQSATSDQQGRVTVTLDPSRNTIIKVRHSVGAAEVDGDHGRWVRTIIFRSTLSIAEMR
ncbi:DUF4198 domain-containing protein [Desulfurispirillum indicum]|uniref:Nickel transport complex, NikM subunit, transmembrane n=1 Tax=Desulfurispirillum indicum (strain ATCC BAA-1389 / DSM 22839 / S5) TaxID=653733 RepID=E6W2T4_DESIS|nr:DUF4198 domain-containing protein [Desulfurispirillum indicum]ADU66759.1 Nickel transport complex, NikM subunit, transmembrane [Desulfurispirillum indicum S5]UCZ56080.1 DUF4198 domain-containing protein [Desulfurispirillum indicum]